MGAVTLNMQVGTIADASSELGQWEPSFRDHVADIPTMKIDQLHYTESAERLRKLLQSGLLRQTDLRDHPDRFFIAHRIMSEWATQLGPDSRILMQKLARDRLMAFKKEQTG